jgi:hypothetical protein
MNAEDTEGDVGERSTFVKAISLLVISAVFAISGRWMAICIKLESIRIIEISSRHPLVPLKSIENVFGSRFSFRLV